MISEGSCDTEDWSNDDKQNIYEFLLGVKKIHNQINAATNTHTHIHADTLSLSHTHSITGV